MTHDLFVLQVACAAAGGELLLQISNAAVRVLLVRHAKFLEVCHLFQKRLQLADAALVAALDLEDLLPQRVRFLPLRVEE